MTVEVRGVCTLLLVFDMRTSLKFYRDVLGFEIVATSDDAAIFELLYQARERGAV